MIVDETIANLQAALRALSEKDPQLVAHLAGPADRSLLDAVAGAFWNAPTAGEVQLLAQAAWLPPVIGSPVWFLEEVAEAYGQGRTDYLVDELCGLKVIQREELSEPLLILADGKHYTIVPEWARRTAKQLDAEDFARQAAAGRVAHETTVIGEAS